MTEAQLLLIASIIEGVLVVGIVSVLVTHRLYAARRRRRMHEDRDRITAALRQWLVGTDTDGVALRETMETRHSAGAVYQLQLAVATHVPLAQREELAELLRRGTWSSHITRQARSFWWWRRLDAARLLSLMATPNDARVIGQLVRDSHPAVQMAAVRCLLRVPSDSLIATVLDRLPRQPVTVRVIQGETLHQLWTATQPLLSERLRRHNAPADHLDVWINVAETIGAPEALPPIIALHTHRDANVRIAVTKALRHYYQPGVAEALSTLLRDADWRVRGQAARGLGALNVQSAIPQLRDALHDDTWWVRFRAGLALAQMHEPGRRALREARAMSDRFASEMAVMISGLSEGSITELTEV